MKPNPIAKTHPLEYNCATRTTDVMPLNWAMAPVLIAIDPGLQGTGMATWVKDELQAAIVINVPSKLRNGAWPDRADYIAETIRAYMDKWRSAYGVEEEDVVVVSEFPEGFGGTKMMAWQTGDLQRLTYLVGLISGRVSPARFVPIPVHCWKGQLPKNIVEERLTKKMGPDLVKQLKPTLHAWDAIGIGMWARGEF